MDPGDPGRRRRARFRARPGHRGHGPSPRTRPSRTSSPRAPPPRPPPPTTPSRRTSGASRPRPTTGSASRPAAPTPRRRAPAPRRRRTRPSRASASAWSPAPTGRPATSRRTAISRPAATWTPWLHLGDYIYEYGTGDYGTRDTVVRQHAPTTRSSPSPTTGSGTGSTRPTPTSRPCTRSPPSSRSGTTTSSPTTPGRAVPRTTPRARRDLDGPSGRRQAGLLRVDAGAPRDRGHHLPPSALRQAGRPLPARPAVLPLPAGRRGQRLGRRPGPYDHGPRPTGLAQGRPEVLRHDLAAGRQLRDDLAVRDRLALGGPAEAAGRTPRPAEGGPRPQHRPVGRLHGRPP